MCETFYNTSTEKIFGTKNINFFPLFNIRVNYLCAGDKIENEMGGACSAYARMGKRRGAYRVLAEKPEGKRPLGRPRHR
jgi:hypothetical protein